MKLKLKLLLLPLLLMIRPKTSSSVPPFLISFTPPKDYFEVTLPLLTDDATPAYSINVLTYSFVDSSDTPSSPPPMSSPPTSAPPSSSPPTSTPPSSSPPTPTATPPAAPPSTSPSPMSSPPTSPPPTSIPPMSSPPTSPPPTSSPPTIAPSTSSPPTANPPSSPPTSAPPTSSPPTSNPPMSAPPTIAPSTSTPPTANPPSSAPTANPPTSAPPTSNPPTSAPPTIAPSTSSPPAANPPTSSPPTSSPPTSSPPASSPPTSIPPTSTPPISSPPTSTPPSSSPPTSTPPTSTPPISSPPMSNPPTSSPPTSTPPASSPPTSNPPTSTPPISSPPTSTPPASSPPTSSSPTSSPPASSPPTSTPPICSPPISTPPASSPPTSTPPASNPPTSSPPISSPPPSSPPISVPPMSSPPTSTPPMSNPPTSNPPVSSPPTSTPPMSNPPTSNPPVSSPPTSSPPAGSPSSTSSPTSTPPTSNPPSSNAPISAPPTTSPPMSNAPAGAPPTGSHPTITPPMSNAPNIRIIRNNFGNAFGSPSTSVIYTPPPVTCEWSHAVLEYQAEYKGEQYGSIAGVWIDGVELLRTSTPQPTEEGCLWNVRKDVTRYASILTQENATLSVMLENIANGEFTGVYQVNVSFHFYSDNALRLPSSVVSEAQTLSRKLISVKSQNIHSLELDRVVKSLYPYDTPADLVVPISGGHEGYWFKIQDEFDVRTTDVQISSKTYKAMLELYVSFHDDDEFWYMNPSDSYIEANHLPTGRGHGAYREVLVTIDGELVGTVIPFPVIFPSGINPLFWSPVVSIGAFDLPSYDIDLTPFLGLLLDNKYHSIGLQVADGLSYWLVGANLHLWRGDSNVIAKTVKYRVPSMDVHRNNNFHQLDGDFELEGERSSEATGWVNSSAGYLKTYLKEKTKFKNKLKFKKQATQRDVSHRTTRTTKVQIEDEKGHRIFDFQVQITYPLKVNIVTRPGSFAHTSLTDTKVVLEQERDERFDGDSRVSRRTQSCDGSILVKDDFVLLSSAENHHNYNYRDRFGCISRKVDVVDGYVLADKTSSKC